mmetsp:Transcript_84920/g.181983  ORF Transcript_84920/g.181983 Transcript_84920/m.181983 type:complete len:252 (-) Transcript_84920:1142-1897(-)
MTPEQLGDDPVPRVGLENYVRADASMAGLLRCHTITIPADVMRHLHNSLLGTDGLPFSLRLQSRAVREHGADGLLTGLLLDCPHLQATGCIDAKGRTVLGPLVENKGRRSNQAGQILSVVLRAGEEEALLRGEHRRDVTGLAPTSRKENTRLVHLENLAKEMVIACLPALLLVLDKLAEQIQIGSPSVWRHEVIAFIGPVGQVWVEDLPEEDASVGLLPTIPVLVETHPEVTSNFVLRRLNQRLGSEVELV